jgi:quercetin dioxygenase-like cupin family protein
MGVIHRFTGREGGWDWDGVPVQEYGAARPGVTVRRFISRADNSNNMEVRYFEMEPGASTSCERHSYEHSVLILRGRGTARLGDEVITVAFGDAVFVPVNEIHQFRASEGETLGILCAVLDKDVRPLVHGEQTITHFDG